MNEIQPDPNCDVYANISGYKEETLDKKIEATKSLIRAVRSNGSISIGCDSLDVSLILKIIESCKDHALFQDGKIIAYIKDGKLIRIK